MLTQQKGVSCQDGCWQCLGPVMCMQGSASELHQHTALMGASAAGQKLKGCETLLANTFTGRRQKGTCLHSPLNHRFSHFHYGSVGLCQKNSAYGHAMVSEKKYSWFLSDVLGYGFINRWNVLQLKPLSSPVDFRSYMQMYCFHKTSYGKPAVYCLLTLCFVPRESIRFLF